MKQMYYGPFWPLGYIAPAYKGAGDALTVNAAAEGLLETTEYFEAAAYALIITPTRQTAGLWVANTGMIFLCLKSAQGTFDAYNFPSTVIAAIPPAAGVVQIPQAAYGGNRYKLDALGIDIDVAGDGAFVTGLMQ